MSLFEGVSGSANNEEQKRKKELNETFVRCRASIWIRFDLVNNASNPSPALRCSMFGRRFLNKLKIHKNERKSSSQPSEGKTKQMIQSHSALMIFNSLCVSHQPPEGRTTSKPGPKPAGGRGKESRGKSLGTTRKSRGHFGPHKVT